MPRHRHPTPSPAVPDSVRDAHAAYTAVDQALIRALQARDDCVVPPAAAEAPAIERQLERARAAAATGDAPADELPALEQALAEARARDTRAQEAAQRVAQTRRGLLARINELSAEHAAAGERLRQAIVEWARALGVEYRRAYEAQRVEVLQLLQVLESVRRLLRAVDGDRDAPILPYGWQDLSLPGWGEGSAIRARHILGDDDAPDLLREQLAAAGIDAELVDALAASLPSLADTY